MKDKDDCEKNPINSGASLQESIATVNQRPASIPAAGSAYSRLTGVMPVVVKGDLKNQNAKRG